MKNYKNWEKRIVARIEEFYIRLKNSISVKWQRFIKKGNEKVTIMLIPHNQKKILNLHVSLFSLAFFIILFGTIFLVFFISISSLASLSNELSTIKANFFQYKSSYEDIIDKVNVLYKNLISTKDEFKKISGIYTNKIKWNTINPMGGSDVELNIENIDPYEQLSNMEFINNNMYLLAKDMYNKRDYFSELARNIPSRTPFREGGIGRITSFFGMRKSPFYGAYVFHQGIDLIQIEGAIIVSTADGVVTHAGPREGYGICVIVQHKNGFETRYAHLMMSLVQKGQDVKKGQPIGKEGRSGRVTGPHLHYEVRINGQATNPLYYLNLAFEYF